MFDDWCNSTTSNVGGHELSILSARAADLPQAIQSLAAVVPGHYASEEHIARQLERLGKAAAAAFVRGKLPTNKSIRSGDLGELLATEYIDEKTDFKAPIKRLRWKDHRNMAMRGEDVIGLQPDAQTGTLSFLKSEAKSRITLANNVVADARAALDKDDGLPSPHALTFISEQLFLQGDTVLADAIDKALLKDGITPDQVRHLLFTLSGNDPTAYLQAVLAGYAGTIPQRGVGLRVATHADFVRDIYDTVMADHGDDG